MTHQSSLSTCKNSCIPTRITDSRCHHPRHGGLELNIQLPDFDVNIPPCPACPSVPTCPPCPQPEPKLKPEPKKKPFDVSELSRLSTRIDINTDDIVDARTEQPTGLKGKECAMIIKNSKNDLEIKGGRLVGSCYNDSECNECVKALNLSILEKQAEPFISTLESAVYVL